MSLMNSKSLMSAKSVILPEWSVDQCGLTRDL